MTTYAVTGASGHLGRLIVHSLLDLHISPFDVIAIARDEDKVEDLADLGVRVREGDYTKPETLVEALEGVDRLVLVSSSEIGSRAAQHGNVLRAAEEAGVERIAYTSILGAPTTTNPLAPEHVETERLLEASSIETTFLRNGWYLENYTAQIPNYVAGGAIYGAADAGRISAATRADFAEAAAVAIASDEVSPWYELGGQAFTMAELAAAVTEASGTPVVYRDMSVDELAAGMVQQGMSEGVAQFFASIDGAIAAGQLYTDSTDLAELIDRSPTSMADAVAAAVTAGK